MTYYFYDLETSGISPRRDRVMQFGGQRTDDNLNPIGEPDNILIKLNPDILPDPEAILITGITPQQTLTDGITEVEFLKYFFSKIVTPDTTFVGFNNVRFDDEFIRFMLWRNFYDAYEWQWKDGRSRFDLLDVARITRALRPDGIEWPHAADGKPTNRLEALTKLNKLKHSNAHSAIGDVFAAIEVAKLVKQKQPKLYDYLLKIRNKNNVAALVNLAQPFVYTSGRYKSEYLNTTVATKVIDCPDRQGALVFDCRENPENYLNLPADKLAELWNDRNKDSDYFPVKAIFYNRCPAVAPINVLDQSSLDRIQLDMNLVNKSVEKLLGDDKFAANVASAYIKIQNNFKQQSITYDPTKVDEMLYEGFLANDDRVSTRLITTSTKDKLAELEIKFIDQRLNSLLPIYKARNYPQILSPDEQQKWDEFRKEKLLGGDSSSQAAIYFQKLNEIAKKSGLKDDQRYLLEELNLYGQSVIPVD